MPPKRDLSLEHIVHQATARANGPAPLLILLHGVGSNEHDLMGLAPSLDPRFTLVSARAPIVLGEASYGWYHVQFTPTGFIIDTDEAEASRAILLKFIDEALAAYDVDRKRVFLMGFSQGCIMSVSAALTEPEKFAGIVGMSGRLLPDTLERAAAPDRLQGLPVLIMHGVTDTVIPIEFGRAIRDAVSSLPVDLSYREYPMGHHVTGESIRDAAQWLTDRLDDSSDWRVRE